MKICKHYTEENNILSTIRQSAADIEPKHVQFQWSYSCLTPTICNPIINIYLKTQLNGALMRYNIYLYQILNEIIFETHVPDAIGHSYDPCKRIHLIVLSFLLNGGGSLKRLLRKGTMVLFTHREKIRTPQTFWKLLLCLQSRQYSSY
jgi:hypothetical protein